MVIIRGFNKIKNKFNFQHLMPYSKIVSFVEILLVVNTTLRFDWIITSYQNQIEYWIHHRKYSQIMKPDQFIH